MAIIQETEPVGSHESFRQGDILQFMRENEAESVVKFGVVINADCDLVH